MHPVCMTYAPCTWHVCVIEPEARASAQLMPQLLVYNCRSGTYVKLSFTRSWRLRKYCLQLREAAAAAMARHKAELPNQPMERSIDIPGQPSGGQAQQAKRAQQRQYRQRGPDPDLDSAQPNQAAAEAAVTRMQEQEYEAKTRGKRMRGKYVQISVYTDG